MLNVFWRKIFFFIKLGRDFRPHGIAGKDTQKKGEGCNAIQPKQKLCQRAQETSHPFCSADAQQNTAGRQKRKKRGKDLCQPDLYAFCRSSQHGGRIPQEGIDQKTGSASINKRTFFQKITPNEKAETLLFKI